MRVQVNVSGLIGTGKWAVTSNFMLGAAVPSQAVLDSVAAAVFAALSASAPFKGGFCSDTTVNQVKMLYYPTNSGSALYVSAFNGTAFAGGSAAVHAPQIAVAASLRTATAGRSFRGRMFLPYRNSNVTAEGAVTSTGQGFVATSVNAFQAAVKAAFTTVSISAVWSIWSPKTNLATAITSILVGNQCDTIRHRNANRAESYAVTAPTALAIPNDGSVEADQAWATMQQLIKMTEEAPSLTPLQFVELVAQAATVIGE